MLANHAVGARAPAPPVVFTLWRYRTSTNFVSQLLYGPKFENQEKKKNAGKRAQQQISCVWETCYRPVKELCGVRCGVRCGPTAAALRPDSRRVTARRRRRAAHLTGEPATPSRTVGAFRTCQRELGRHAAGRDRVSSWFYLSVL